MNILDQYVIPLQGLEEGDYVYTFEVTDTFFDEFENSEIKKGKLDAEVILSKHASVITITFNLNGSVELLCDRCLENFNYKVSSSNSLFIKFGLVDNDKNGDIIYISDPEQQINIAQYLYEFAHLNIPIKRIHPENEKGESLCNKEMLKKLNELSDNKTNIDPRWEELKKLYK